MLTLAALNPAAVTIWPAVGKEAGLWQVNVMAQGSDGWRIAYHSDPSIAFQHLGLDVDPATCLSIIQQCREGKTAMGRPKGSTNKPKDAAAAPKRASTPKAAPAANATPEIESALRSHLEFVAAATAVDDTTPSYAFALIHENRLTAFNGVLAAGARVQEAVTAAPNVGKMVRALDLVGANFTAVAQGAKLIIENAKGERVAVDCYNPAEMPAVVPDGATIQIDDRLLAAFKAVEKLAGDKRATVLEASVLLAGQSVAATDKTVIVEYWHGLTLPTLTLPKASVAAIVKAGKSLAWFGYSDRTATFWFADNTFMQTRLYDEAWPEGWQNNLPRVLSEEVTLTDEFWKAYDKVAPFADDGYVRVRDGVIGSHADPMAGASIPTTLTHADGFKIDIKRTKLVRPFMHKIGFADEREVLGFFSAGTFEAGNMVRGAIGYEPDATEEGAAPAPAPLNGEILPPEPAAPSVRDLFPIEPAFTAAGLVPGQPPAAAAPVAAPIGAPIAPTPPAPAAVPPVPVQPEPDPVVFPDFAKLGFGAPAPEPEPAAPAPAAGWAIPS